MDPAHDSLAPETADIETASDAYAARFSGETGAWILAVQARAVRGLLGEPADGPLLDVGGGHGQLAGPLTQAGFDVTVLGSSEACRKRVRPFETTGRCRFVAGEVTRLPFADGAFETALCIRLLTHCARWRELAAELGRVSRRAVIVEYPLHNGLHRLAPLLFGAKKRLEGNTRHWRPFRHADVTAAFEAAGFRETGLVRQFFWPLALHRLLGRRALSERLEAGARRAGWTARTGSPALSRMTRMGA